MITALRHLVIGLALLNFGSISAAEEPLTLAVHPYLPAAEIKARFQPLAAHLGKTLGRSVEIRVGGDYEEHIQAVGNNRVDVAFVGPAAYVVIRSRYGQKPLVARFEANGQPFLYGVKATRTENKIESLDQLRDARFAFGDKISTMSHIVPRYMLLTAGLARGLPKGHEFLGSHKNVAIGIPAGDYDAGAMKKEVFDEFQSQGLRAVALTAGVPDHLFIASTELPVDDLEPVREAMLELHKTTTGRAILTGLHKNPARLVPATDAEYDQLRVIFKTVENAIVTEGK